MRAKEHGLKEHGDKLWEKLGDAGEAKKDMNANVILKRMGGGTTMSDRGGEPGGTESKKLSYKKMAPTIKDTGSTLPKSPKGEAEGAYAGELGTGKEKTSHMAQKVGSPRKGY